MKSRGFTLPEVLVVIALLGILGLGLISLYSAQNKLTTDEASLTQAQAELAVGLNSAMPFMQSAFEVLASHIIDSVTYNTSSDTLVLSLPTVDSSNNIVSGSYDYIVFLKTNDDKFNMITDAAVGSKRRIGTRTLIRKVSSLAFSYEDNVTPSNSTWFTVEVQALVKITASTQTLSAMQRISLRNHNE